MQAHTSNRRFAPLCDGFQNKSCMEKGTNGNCKYDQSKAHQCAKCLANNHGANWPGGCSAYTGGGAHNSSKKHMGGKGGGKGGKGKGGKDKR